MPESVTGGASGAGFKAWLSRECGRVYALKGKPVLLHDQTHEAIASLPGRHTSPGGLRALAAWAEAPAGRRGPVPVPGLLVWMEHGAPVHADWLDDIHRLVGTGAAALEAAP